MFFPLLSRKLARWMETEGLWKGSRSWLEGGFHANIAFGTTALVSICILIQTRLVYKWINPALLRVQHLLLSHTQQRSFTQTETPCRSQLHAGTLLCGCTPICMHPKCIHVLLSPALKLCFSSLFRKVCILSQMCIPNSSPVTCWLAPLGRSSRWHLECTCGDICTSGTGSLRSHRIDT